MDEEIALKRLAEMVEQYLKDYPEMAEKLETECEQVLTVFHFPEEHRKKLRTTNALERLNQEFKRRSRVIRIFPNRASCLRLICALAMETNEEWQERRYLKKIEKTNSTLSNRKQKTKPTLVRNYA